MSINENTKIMKESKGRHNEISNLLENAPTTDEQVLQVYLNKVIDQKTPLLCQWIYDNADKIVRIVEKEGVCFYTVYLEILMYLRERIKSNPSYDKKQSRNLHKISFSPK